MFLDPTYQEGSWSVAKFSKGKDWIKSIGFLDLITEIID